MEEAKKECMLKGHTYDANCPICNDPKKQKKEVKKVLKDLKEYKLVPETYSTVPVVILYKNDKAQFIGGHDKTLDFCEIANSL